MFSAAQDMTDELWAIISASRVKLGTILVRDVAFDESRSTLMKSDAFDLIDIGP